ncbi:hypothetical protein KW791_03945 [Candidatus Parcubacteria bacterium]|nr:hypothetical protein [Candidatus Parcubacteria bacterium]
MDQKEALKTLITHSSLIAEDIKIKLVEKIDTLSDQEIEALGLILSKEFSEDDNTQVIDQLVDQIDSELK